MVVSSTGKPLKKIVDLDPHGWHWDTLTPPTVSMIRLLPPTALLLRSFDSEPPVLIPLFLPSPVLKHSSPIVPTCRCCTLGWNIVQAETKLWRSASCSMLFNAVPLILPFFTNWELWLLISSGLSKSIP